MLKSIKLISISFIQTVRRQELIIDDCRISYITNDSFPSQKLVYLFLHGWAGEGTNFLQVFTGLNLADYIALDFPGFGHSSHLRRPWSLADYAKVLERFLREILSGDAQLVVIAHSFGGRVLLRYLHELRRTDPRIAKIILIGVPFFRNLSTMTKLKIFVASQAKSLLKLAPTKTANRIRQTAYQVLGVDDYKQLQDENLQETFKKIVSEDLSGYIDTLSQYDISMIWGTADDQAPFADAEAVASKLSIDIHPIEGAGHFPYIGDGSDRFSEVFATICDIDKEIGH